VLCNDVNGELTTASGRQVLVRAVGVNRASPLVLILHGYTGTPTGIEKYAEFTALANEASVVVAYPEGTPVPKNEGFGWNTGAGIFSTSGVDDVAALNEMLDTIMATGCVDPAHVTIAGESNGAGMSLVAICESGLRARVESAVIVIPAVDPAVLAQCRAGGSPIPLSVVAGRLDRTVPYEGGRGTLLPQETWFGQAAQIVNGCRAGEPVRSTVTSQVELLAPSDCDVCTEIYSVADGTHTWPGSSTGTGGLQPGTFDLSIRLLALAVARQPGCL